MASRVRIVLLRDNEVISVLVVDQEVWGPKGPLLSLIDLGVGGEILAWNGRAMAAGGHVGLELTPLTRDADGRVEAGVEPPLVVRWNERAGRFQSYDCVDDGESGERCGFRDESGD